MSSGNLSHFAFWWWSVSNNSLGAFRILFLVCILMMTSFRKFFFYCAAICFRRSFMCFNNSFYCAAIGFRKSFAMKFTASSCANSLQTRTQCQRWFIIHHLSYIIYPISFILYKSSLLLYRLSCKQIPNVRGDLLVIIESQFEPNFLFILSMIDEVHKVEMNNWETKHVDKNIDTYWG